MGTAGSCPLGASRVPEAQTFELKDPRSGLLLQLESDGRSISAFGSDGKRVWQVDPFVDAKMRPYRTPHPVIARLAVMPNCAIQNLSRDARLNDHFISVQFDSSQSGLLDAKTGHFIFMGQN
jgi:hypothetical protein